MAENSTELIRRSLEEAIATERACENEWRAFSRQGDDEEIQRAFAFHADEARRHWGRLALRLQQGGQYASPAGEVNTRAIDLPAKPGRASRAEEERLVQNLIYAYSAQSNASAMCLALASVAAAAGDLETGDLAREIQAGHSQAAQNLLHFLPSRSKIAFNVLTAGEIDPSVETRAVENRVR